MFNVKNNLKFFMSSLLIISMFITIFSNIAYAKNIPKGIDINLELSNNDLKNVKQSIKTILDSEYEVMKTWEFKSCKNIINDDKLLELIDQTNKFKVEWFKAVDLKISDYFSNINIQKILQSDKKKYYVYVNYNIDFNLVNSDVKSSSSNEEHIFEIEENSNKWYVTKKIDLLDLQDMNNNSAKKIRSFDELNIDNDKYNYIINNKIDSIKDISKNIDKYIQKQNREKINYEKNPEIRVAYSGYNASNAVAYAHRWAKGRNPSFRDFGNQDCTNFVSQCVYNGGIPATSTWCGSSNAWIRVKDFYTYMRNNGYTFGGDSNSNSRLGDVIQLYHNDWNHSVIITGRNGSGWLYSAHSTNRKDYPILNVYPSSTYTNIRYIKFWH